MQCVAHYSNSNRTYSKLKTLSENQLDRLLEAKCFREKETLDANRHLTQCATVPTKDDFDSSVHGIHLDPCYKSFTKILCPSRKRKLQDEFPQVNQRIKRQKRSSSTTDLFPATCFKCKGVRKKKRGKRDKIAYPHKVTLDSAAKKLKLAALKLNDGPRIIQFDARDTTQSGLQYLMEKEIMTHDDCYREYTRCLNENSKEENLSSPDDVTGDFEAVREFINDNILHCNNAVSMVTLHNLYKTGCDNVNARTYRSKLKNRIKSEFGNQLLFLTINSTTPQVVVSSEGISNNTILKNKGEIVKECAKQLRQEILHYASNYSMPWPLTTETIADGEKTLPESVTEFVSYLLKPENHSLSESMKRLVLSYSSDLIAAVSRGKVVTLKQFLLGIGLHNITGLKAPIRILSHLGHCIDYNLVCEIETTQAEEAIKQLESMERSTSATDTELTYWWADNFNQTLETQTGHGAIDSTHIVEFSEGITSQEHVSQLKSNLFVIACFYIKYCLFLCFSGLGVFL